MTQKERMLAAQLYRVDAGLAEEMQRTRALLQQINNELDRKRRETLFRQLLGGARERFVIESPFRCDYGSHIYLGENFYANFECIILDQCDVRFGDNVMLGPRVSIFTAGHPLDPEVRNTGLEFGRPVTIGNNVWIGGDVTINGNVSIGDNAVIGSGSVVTRDIPAGCVAAGNPCRVLRRLTSEDRMHWQSLADAWHADCDA